MVTKDDIMNTKMTNILDAVETMPYPKLLHALETAAKLSLGQEHALTSGLSFMRANADQGDESSEKLWEFVQGEIATLDGAQRKQFFMYVNISVNAGNLMHERSN